MHIRYPAQAKRANKSAYLRSFDVSQYNVETRPASINCEYTNRGLFLFLILTCMFLIAKNVPVSCSALCHWLGGLTLLVVGVIGLLVQLGVFMTSPWGWTWPILVLVWGLVVLFNVGCKECNK